MNNKLKEIRINMKLTQQDIANKLCMKQQQYARYEINLYSMNLQTFRLICKELNIKSSDILDF